MAQDLRVQRIAFLSANLFSWADQSIAAEVLFRGLLGQNPTKRVSAPLITSTLHQGNAHVAVARISAVLARACQISAGDDFDGAFGPKSACRVLAVFHIKP